MATVHYHVGGSLPTLLGVLLMLIVVIGWLNTGALAGLVTHLVRMTRTDKMTDNVRMTAFLSRIGVTLKASDIAGEAAKWLVRLMLFDLAAKQCGLTQVTFLVNGILAMISRTLVFLLLLGVGAFLGNLLAGVIRGAASGARRGKTALVKNLTWGAVMAFANVAAVSVSSALNIVHTLTLGLAATVFLVFGFSLGIDKQETASRLTEQWIGQTNSWIVNSWIVNSWIVNSWIVNSWIVNSWIGQKKSRAAKVSQEPQLTEIKPYA
ncbi:MAG: hypothetical protein ACRYFS_15170 [Janthinobacterium lividum]